MARQKSSTAIVPPTQTSHVQTQVQPQVQNSSSSRHKKEREKEKEKEKEKPSQEIIPKPHEEKHFYAIRNAILPSHLVTGRFFALQEQIILRGQVVKFDGGLNTRSVKYDTLTQSIQVRYQGLYSVSFTITLKSIDADGVEAIFGIEILEGDSTEYAAVPYSRGLITADVDEYTQLSGTWLGHLRDKAKVRLVNDTKNRRGKNNEEILQRLKLGGFEARQVPHTTLEISLVGDVQECKEGEDNEK